MSTHGILRHLSCCVDTARRLNDALFCQETQVLICSLGSIETSSFVDAWIRVIGLDSNTLSSCAGVLIRPSSTLMHTIPPGTAVRLCPTQLGPILRGEPNFEGTRVLLLVDVTKFNRPSTTDKVLLCWAWKHAFPDVPEAVVRMMSEDGHLSPGHLRDERQLIRPLLSSLAQHGGSTNIQLSIILCNASLLLASEPACTSPLAAGAQAAPPRHPTASRMLHQARSAIMEAANVAIEAIQAQCLAEAARMGQLNFVAAVTPRVHVLVAPDLVPLPAPVGPQIPPGALLPPGALPPSFRGRHTRRLGQLVSECVGRCG